MSARSVQCLVRRSWQVLCMRATPAACTHTANTQWRRASTQTHITDTTENASKIHSKKKINKAESHIYNNIYPWTTKSDLAAHLLQSKIYDNKNILVVNKPYGVSQNPPKVGRKGIYYGRTPPVHISIADVLPILKEMTGLEYLELAVSPEKWNSGVMVFRKNSSREVDYSVRVARENRRCSRSYWVLTRHTPHPATQDLRQCATKLDPSSTIGPQIVMNPSRTKISRHEHQAFYVQHKTLCVSDATGTALVNVSVTSTKNNSVRVWLSHCLAVPLGDHLFSARVAHLMGRPIPVPISRMSGKGTAHSYEFMQKIDLLPSLQDLIPLSIHLRSLTLYDFFKVRSEKKKRKAEVEAAAISDSSQQPTYEVSGDDLILTAPLPEHFQWTMDKLGMECAQ